MTANRKAAWLSACLLVAATCVACSNGSPDDGGGAGGGGAGGGADAATDAPAVDVAIEATPDDATAGDGGTCPESLAEACAAGEGPGMFGVACASTWAEALADSHYCGSTITEWTAECGAYRARVAVNVDFSYTYYYDAASGDLVAVYNDGLVKGVVCVGGPADFVPPDCGPLVTLNPCRGPDGGSSDATAD